jgi:hypothetical protein
MQLNRRLLIAPLGIVIILAILAIGAFIYNKWSPQPVNSPLSAGSSQGSLLADDPLVYLPDTGLVQLTTPETSISYYVTNIDILNALGTDLGYADQQEPGTQDHLVILDYGKPIYQGGSYGAKLLFYDRQIVYTPDIISSAVDFARGYFYGTGYDLNSHIRMVISVNNCCWGDSLSLFQGHGAAWAGVVNQIKNQIVADHYDSQVDVIAGGDIQEQDPGGNRPYSSTQWLAYYMANSNCVPESDNSVKGCFYNFGNLVIMVSGTGCATAYSTTTWHACDVWYVSWGAQRTNEARFARPLPEIYHNAVAHPPWGSDANPWQALSIFSYQQMNAGPMYFVGSLTQRARCDDNCGSGNNYPWEGFQLLSRALASNTTTRQAMRWSTDIALQP